MNRILCSLLLVLSITGCSSGAEGNNASVEDADEARAAAWEFLQQEGVDRYINEETWDEAEVTEVTITGESSYAWLDDSYAGKEVLKVRFGEAEGGVAAAVTTILVDPDTDEVIGFVPGD